jgi:hypothetical protein
MMNSTWKLPLAAMATALVFALGAMPSQADSAMAGSGDLKSDHAARQAPAASDKAAKVSDSIDAAADRPASAEAADISEPSRDVAAVSGDAAADDAVVRSRSFTKSIVTPHMTMSITHSIGMAKDEDGDRAMAKAMARAQALDTPGQTRTDVMTKTSVKVDGDAASDATATADAEVNDSGMSVATFGETSVAVQ